MSRHVYKYIACNPITFTVLKYSCKFSMNSGFHPTGLSKKLSFLCWENSCGTHHTAGSVPGAGDTSGMRQQTPLPQWKSLSRVRLCDPMDYTVHGILQARILKWVAFPFSSRSSQPGIKPRTPAFWEDSLSAEPQGKPKNSGVGRLSFLQRIFPTQESNRGGHILWKRHIIA